MDLYQLVFGILFFGYAVFIILDIVFANIFAKRYFAYMLAMALGQIIATINAFIFHKYVTFKSPVKGQAVIMEFFRFCTIYIFTFSLSLLLLPFFVEILHLRPHISGAIVILFCTIISYTGHSRFSFNYEKVV
ncbi:MAG TPA: GtrA family protein [Flavobacteriales bacterium]|nr:GtrA family protein [Flavobacteriales bacterium]